MKVLWAETCSNVCQILKYCVCNTSFLFNIMEYNEMNQNEKKTLISVHQDGRQLLIIHARLLEAESSISNLCPRRAIITCPFADLLFQQMCLCNMNWVSSVDKLAHRSGGRGLIPVIVWSFSLNVRAGLASTRPPVRWAPRALSAFGRSTGTRSWTFFPPSSEVPQ